MYESNHRKKLQKTSRQNFTWNRAAMNIKII